MASSISEIHSADVSLPLVLAVDSHGLYSTITTIHEGRDYRLRPTLSQLRDSFESKELSVMQWIAGKKNTADALSKQNPIIFKILIEWSQQASYTLRFLQELSESL